MAKRVDVAKEISDLFVLDDEGKSKQRPDTREVILRGDYAGEVALLVIAKLMTEYNIVGLTNDATNDESNIPNLNGSPTLLCVDARKYSDSLEISREIRKANEGCPVFTLAILEKEEAQTPFSKRDSIPFDSYEEDIDYLVSDMNK